MPETVTRPEPKVYYDRERQVMVGPLGYWKVGDTFEIKGRTYHVGSVDLDGGAVAWEHDYLLSLGGREKKRGRTVDEVLHSLRDVRTGKPVLELTPAQVKQCKAIAAHGERLRAQHDAAGGSFERLVEGKDA